MAAKTTNKSTDTKSNKRPVLHTPNDTIPDEYTETTFCSAKSISGVRFELDALSRPSWIKNPRPCTYGWRTPIAVLSVSKISAITAKSIRLVYANV